MKEKISLYDWCIKNKRKDLIDSLQKAKVNISIIKTISYASKKLLPWFCPKCKEKYDKLIKTNPNLPKFYIQEYEVRQKTIGKNRCRICSCRGTKGIISGVNDLKTFCLEHKNRYGHLIKEWSSLNQFGMDTIAPNYTKKVYWYCPKCGYGTNGEWYVEPNSRINNGNNCPNCSSELRKSLAEKAVFYYIKQSLPTAIENYKIPDTNQLELDIYIKDLSLGIEYDGSYWHNINPQKDQHKYKICKQHDIHLLRLREKGCKDIPDIADQCYILTSINNKDLNNAINYVFEYIKTLTNKEIKVPNIDWEKDFSKIENLIELQVKENSVAKYPLLLQQWHPSLNGVTKPDRVYAQSNVKRYWRCLECGYGTNGEWHVSPNSRIENSKNNKINGCPACANKVLYKGYNDFETYCNNHEEYNYLLNEWDEKANNEKGLKKDYIRFNSSKIVSWECEKCHNKWDSKLNDRTVKNRDCTICLGKEVKKGINDIATTHPKIAEQWDDEKNLKENGRTKYNTSHGYKKKIWWICENGHSYDASPNDRTNKNTGCRYCSNLDVLQGYNDLETFCNKRENKEANEHLLNEWYKYNKLKPNEVVYGSNEVVKWECQKCHNIWETEVRARVTYIQKNGKLHKGTGCDKCARKQKAINLRIKKTKGKELSLINSELAKEWHPDKSKNYSQKWGFILTPDNTSANSHDKVWWKCPVCGYEWQAQVKSRNRGAGCPNCAKNKTKRQIKNNICKY